MHSKLSTRAEALPSDRPLSRFGAVGIALAIISVGLSIPIFIYLRAHGLVPRLLSAGVMLLGFLSIACGLILGTVRRGAVRKPS